MLTKVSILIPCYNCATLIDRMIESIINNGYDHNLIEIVLMNDGSKDNTLEVIQKYAKQYPFIKAYDHEHIGLCRIRYEAIKHCSCDYFIFADADDCFAKNGITNLMYSINNGETPDMVISKAWRHKNWGRKLSFFALNKTYHKKDNYITYLKRSWFWMWNTVYSKKFFFETKYYPINIVTKEGTYLMSYLLMHKPKMIFTNKHTYHFNIHKNSDSHNVSNLELRMNDRKECFIGITKFLLLNKEKTGDELFNLLFNNTFFVIFSELLHFFNKMGNNVTYVSNTINELIKFIKNNNLQIKSPSGWWKRIVYFFYIKPQIRKFL